MHNRHCEALVFAALGRAHRHHGWLLDSAVLPTSRLMIDFKKTP
jgi:hypothetical protein